MDRESSILLRKIAHVPKLVLRCLREKLAGKIGNTLGINLMARH